MSRTSTTRRSSSPSITPRASPFFDTRATDIAKLLGTYDSLEDERDDEERFGEPLEAFHSSFYEMVGLDANGEEAIESDDDEDGSSGDEFDSDGYDDDDEDDDEDDQPGYGDDEIDRSSLIGNDEEQDEWDEHEYSDAELDAEEGVSVSGDEETEEVDSEGEDERKRKDLYNWDHHGQHMAYRGSGLTLIKLPLAAETWTQVALRVKTMEWSHVGIV